MMIAKHHGLRQRDFQADQLMSRQRWLTCQSVAQELSQACGKAIRAELSLSLQEMLCLADLADLAALRGSLPACYRLQRLLPGALNDARALRILQAWFRMVWALGNLGILGCGRSARQGLGGGAGPRLSYSLRRCAWHTPQLRPEPLAITRGAGALRITARSGMGGYEGSWLNMARRLKPHV